MGTTLKQAVGFYVMPRITFKMTRDKMLYHHFLEQANYIKSAKCEVGELVTSILSLSNDTGWSRDQIRDSIKRLHNDNLIEFESSRAGIKVRIISYKELQKLDNYSKKDEKNPQPNPQQDPQPNPQPNPQQDPQQEETGNDWEGKGNEWLEGDNPQQDPQPNPQPKSHGDSHTITSFKQHINNNKHIKDLRGNFSDIKHIKLFIELAEQFKPLGLNQKILVNYFDMIRLTRTTCKISVNVCISIWDRLSKYANEKDKLHYALLQHVLNHDDKKEQYTFGILRNTSESEARRKMIRLMNTKGADDYERDRSSIEQSGADELDQLSL